eukprot:gene5094-34894_t
MATSSTPPLPDSMTALTFQGKQDIAFKQIPTPSLVHPTDVIVRVTLCAICGSDLHPYNERERGIACNTVVGHEFVGTVKSLQIGDRVMSPFTASCGKCYYCSLGVTVPEEERCGLHGSQAQFVRVPLADSTLVKIPEDITDEQGILLGDILSTAFFCAESGGCGPGQTVAVIGCGPVGLLAIVAAKHFKIFAVDSVAARLEMAASLGAESLNFERSDVVAAIKEQTDGRGADVALEVVGASSALKLAFDVLRPVGTLSSVGVHTADNFPFSPGQGYDKNITYKSGRCPARFMMEKLVPLLASGALSEATKIITHRRPLSEGVESYIAFDQKSDGMIKCLLDPWA